MTKSNYDVAKLSNAFSTGGGGVNFENSVQAVFVLALLIDGYAPVADFPIKKIEFQGKHLGHDVDDLIVMESEGKGAKLYCQIKHSLAITKKDKVFQEVITAAWSDFNKSNFNPEIDKIALITGFIALKSIKSLRYIHDQAIDTLNAETFLERIRLSNFSSNSDREILDTIKHCILHANKNKEITDDEFWKFCRCFSIAVFDLDYRNSVNRILIKSLIKCKTEQDATIVWSRLFEQCCLWNQKAATVIKNSIPDDILELFGYNNHQSSMIVDLKLDDFWAKIAFLGGWDEKNEYDTKVIEQLFCIKYFDFQQKCRNVLLEGSEYIEFHDGIWKVKNRKEILYSARQFYFDEILIRTYEIVGEYLKEKNKQFMDDGTFNIIIPPSGRYNNSEMLRRGLLESLCILSNTANDVYYNVHMMNTRSRLLIESLFKNSDWIQLISISDVVGILAEMNPMAYLECFEKLICNKPEEILRLFPTKKSSTLFEQNHISYYLFAIERLAWGEEYLVQSIRCLGELESLNYEKTNWANTPINTITTILLPFMPQTLASIEKQKNALQTLRVDYPELCWSVINSLLPDDGGMVTTGSVRPNYLPIDIPENIEINNEQYETLFQYYIEQAIILADNDSEKLVQLVDHIAYMPHDKTVDFLNKIKTESSVWSEKKQYDLWMKLKELKYKIIAQSDGNFSGNELFELLCNTIDEIEPRNIIYKAKWYYLSNFNEFVRMERAWEEKDKQKQNAVEEIYRFYDINKLIEFGISVNALYEVGNRIGKYLSVEEVSRIIASEQLEKNSIFYSSLLNSFLLKNGVTVIKELGLAKQSPTIIATVLREAPFNQTLIDMISEYLSEDEALFWGSVNIRPNSIVNIDYDINVVIKTLLSFNRATHVLEIIGEYINNLVIDEELICEALMQAPLEGVLSQYLSYSTQKLIKYLQNSDAIARDKLSEIEFVYLPWLNNYSRTKPRAIKYRLANEPDYFCEMVRLMYKGRHDEHSNEKLSDGLSERLFKLIYQFDVVPGTDWDGDFNPDIFESWMKEVIHWAKENDRFEVTMYTIGNGLSYAKFDDKNILNETIMNTLNDKEHDEIRRGYSMGVYNQRGVHFVDPEGKEEKAFADKYQRRAEAVEQLGYSRFASTLQSIADVYLAEVERNAKRFNEEDD